MNTHTATARAEKTHPVHIGDHLREWRQRRHLSQLDLAVEAEISARHLSFVETGRAAPSRDMVLKLAERLDVPLRERNVLLVAAGYAPAFPQRSLDDPALKSARAAIDLVLRAHEPNPALAYDRHWNLVSANRMVMPLLDGIPARLLGQPFNILRLAFHPEALAARLSNVIACITSAKGPCRSLKVAVVSPAPLAPTRVRERIRIHSSAGARKKYRLISGLIKVHSRMSTICATPLEKSAAARPAR